ncbi:etoposide-induced protein 2.4 (EI24) domain-containing protein [Sarocladium implicatum]|nr:etoposide-induced protein 2.4 (EI24) domain-containing protein [Sarocladium implicatum]
MSDSVDAPSGKQSRNRMIDSVTDNAQQVIKEDYVKARDVAFQAARSRAYLYPIKGIMYFVTHRTLWKPFLSRLGPYVALSVSVVAGMFTFTYLPQLALLVFVNGPLAVFTTVLLILNESATITNMISRNWLLQDALLDTFDGTLIARDATNMVREGREVKSGSDPMQKLGKILKSPFEKFSPKAIIRYFMYLPLNFIPVVGTAVFIFLQGRNRGKIVHGRYFQLKKWNNSQREDWLEKHVGPYTAFGLVATLLEMIPLASMFFTYTNTVGAALWAADIESKSTKMTDSTAPSLRETAEKADEL